MDKSGGNRYGKFSASIMAGKGERIEFHNIVGIICIATVTLSVVCSIWFGWKIRAEVKALDHENRSLKSLANQHRTLETRQAELMSRELIEKKASVLGLKKPGRKQVIRP